MYGYLDLFALAPLVLVLVHVLVLVLDDIVLATRLSVHETKKCLIDCLIMCL